MDSVCEILINVVTANKPKMLTGLPKGNGVSTGGPRSPVVNSKAPAERDGPNPLWHGNETWEAHISPSIGKATRKGSRWRCGYRNVEKAKAPL